MKIKYLLNEGFKYNEDKTIVYKIKEYSICFYCVYDEDNEIISGYNELMFKDLTTINKVLKNYCKSEFK